MQMAAVDEILVGVVAYRGGWGVGGVTDRWPALLDEHLPGWESLGSSWLDEWCPFPVLVSFAVNESTPWAGATTVGDVVIASPEKRRLLAGNRMVFSARRPEAVELAWTLAATFADAVGAAWAVGGEELERWDSDKPKTSYGSLFRFLPGLYERVWLSERLLTITGLQTAPRDSLGVLAVQRGSDISAALETLRPHPKLASALSLTSPHLNTEIGSYKPTKRALAQAATHDAVPMRDDELESLLTEGQPRDLWLSYERVEAVTLDDLRLALQAAMVTDNQWSPPMVSPVWWDDTTVGLTLQPDNEAIGPDRIITALLHWERHHRLVRLGAVTTSIYSSPFFPSRSMPFAPDMMPDFDNEHPTIARYRAGLQEESDRHSWTWGLRGVLLGDPFIVTERLDGLAAALRDFAARLAELDQGVILTVGRIDGPLTQERWDKAILRIRNGTTTFLGLSRNTGHIAGLDRISCELWLGDKLMGTELSLDCERQSDEPIGPDEMTEWLIRFAVSSGMAQGSLHPYPGGSDGNSRAVMTAADQEGVQYTNDALVRYAQGSAWGLWFTDEHIAGLGGSDRITNEAPVARVVLLHGGVWLQLTDSPSPDFVGAMAALDTFLLPITPTIDQLRELGGTISYEPDPMADIITTAADHYANFKGAAVQVVGWDRVREEMEVTAFPGAALDDIQRAAIERCLVAWIEHGTVNGYGRGTFHGWTSGDWDEDGLHVPVDSGSQDVNWKRAINDLAKRLAGCANTWSIEKISLRLGATIDE